MLIDCPPSLGLLTLNALAAADEVIIPLQPHFLALQGLGKLLETVSLVQRRINPRLKVTGVILCMYEANTKLGGEVVADLRELPRGVAAARICRGRRPASSRRSSAATSSWPSAPLRQDDLRVRAQFPRGRRLRRAGR